MACSRDRSRSPTNNDEWKIVNKGKNAYGGAIINILNSTGHTPRKLVISDDHTLNSVVTFDVDGLLGKRDIKPEFILNPASTKKDGLDVTLSIKDETWLEYFKFLDAQMVALIFKEQKQIFGPKSEMSLDTLKLVYQPCVKTDGSYEPTFKTKIILAGPDFLKTKMRVYHDAGEDVAIRSYTEGEGWNFLSENLGEHKLRGFKCVPIMSFRNLKIWSANSKVSLSMDASSIWFYPSGKSVGRGSASTADTLSMVDYLDALPNGGTFST